MSTSAVLRSHEEEAFLKQSIAAAEATRLQHSISLTRAHLIPLLNPHVLSDSRVVKRSVSFQELCIV